MKQIGVLNLEYRITFSTYFPKQRPEQRPVERDEGPIAERRQGCEGGPSTDRWESVLLF